MTRIFQDGLEQGFVGTGSVWPTTSGAPAIESTIVHSGSKSVKFPSGAANYLQTSVSGVGGNSGTGGYYGLWVYLSGSPSSAVAILQIRNSNMKLRLNTDRTLSYLESVGVVVGTTTTAIPTQTWTLVSAYIKSDSSTSTDDGATQVRIGTGSSEINVTNINNANTVFDIVRIGAIDVDAGIDIYIDDVVVNSDQGTLNNSWPATSYGMVQIVPGSDSSPVDWSTVGSPPSHADALADISGTDTTKYITSSSNTSNLEDRWNMADTPVAIGSADTISAIMFGVRGGGDATQTRPANLRLRDAGGATVDSATLDWNINGWKTIYPAITRELTHGGIIQQLTTSANTYAVMGTVGSTEKLAQSFVAGSAAISRVAIHCRKSGSPTDNLILDIVSVLDGSSLASASISGSTLTTTYSFVEFTLATPVSLVNGNTYYLQLTRSGGNDGSNFYQFLGGGSNLYANGSIWRSNSGTWSELTTDDLAFIIYDPFAKSYLDGMLASAIDANTSTRVINWTAVWCCIDFTAAVVPPGGDSIIPLPQRHFRMVRGLGR